MIFSTVTVINITTAVADIFYYKLAFGIFVSLSVVMLLFLVLTLVCIYKKKKIKSGIKINFYEDMRIIASHMNIIIIIYDFRKQET